MRFKFFQTSLRDAKKTDVIALTFASATFCNIRRNACGGPPNLRRHSISIFVWKLSRQEVTLFSETHRVLPDSQIAIRLDRHQNTFLNTQFGIESRQ